MPKFLSFFLLLISSFNISAVAQSYHFKGKVENSNGKPLSNALIRIYSLNNSSPISSTTSNKDGLFNLAVDLNRHYLIEFSHALMVIQKEEISFDGKTDSIKIFTLKEKVNLLNEVAVNGKTPLISRKNDKLIVNVSNNNLLQGKNFNQLIQLAPGVQVINNEILINGVSGVTIYIDDQPLKLSGNALKNYLANTNAADIKNIEIIGSPPAEYAAEGTGGIININLRKPTIDGLTGYLGGTQSFGLGRYPSTNPYVAINLKKKKLQLNARYNYQFRKEYFSDTQKRLLTDQSVLSSATERTTLANQNNLTFGLGYDIDNKQNIGLNYSGNYASEKETSLSNATIVSPNTVTNQFSSGNFKNISKTDYHNFGLNYRFFTDTLKSKLSISGDFTRNLKNEKSEIESTINDFRNNLLSDTLYNYLFPSSSDLYTGEVKYLKVFKSGFELNLGSRLSKASINTDNSVELFQRDSFAEDPQYRFNYLYHELITAGFVEGSGKFLTVNFKVGLRGENTRVETSLNSLNSTSYNRKDYLNLFPSVYLGRDFGDKKYYNVSLSFNRRIARPSYSTLNPYIFYVDNKTISTGNPNLNPSLASNIQLSLTLKNKYNLSLLYSNVSGQIQRIISIDSTDIARQTWQNVGNTRLYNINLSAPFNISKFWTTNNTLLLQYKEINTNEYQVGKGTFVFQNNNEFEITNSLSLSLSTYYTPRSIYANTITKGYGDISAGLVKKMWSNKLLLNINLEDILYSNNPETTSYYNGYIITRHPKFQTRKLYISVRYNFKSGKIFKKNTYEKSSSDESERL